MTSVAADPFEDEQTRELPAALRTFQDLAPFVRQDAPSARELVADEDIVDDDVRLQERTLQLPPVTQPISIPAMALDVAPPRTPAAGPSYASLFTAERLAAVAREPLAMIVAASFLLACLLAGVVGIAVGRTSAAHAQPTLTGAVARTPRVAAVEGAHESITVPPPMAPEKLTVVEEAPAPVAPAPARHFARRGGFQRPANLARR